MPNTNQEQTPLFYTNVIQTLDNVENDQFKSLEAGESYLNTTNRHLLYRVEFLNALGKYQAFYDILKPAESITKTNPLNKVKIYI